MPRGWPPARSRRSAPSMRPRGPRRPPRWRAPSRPGPPGTAAAVGWVQWAERRRRRRRRRAPPAGSPPPPTLRQRRGHLLVRCGAAAACRSRQPPPRPLRLRGWVRDEEGAAQAVLGGGLVALEAAGELEPLPLPRQLRLHLHLRGELAVGRLPSLLDALQLRPRLLDRLGVGGLACLVPGGRGVEDVLSVLLARRLQLCGRRRRRRRRCCGRRALRGRFSTCGPTPGTAAGREAQPPPTRRARPPLAQAREPPLEREPTQPLHVHRLRAAGVLPTEAPPAAQREHGSRGARREWKWASSRLEEKMNRDPEVVGADDRHSTLGTVEGR